MYRTAKRISLLILAILITATSFGQTSESSGVPVFTADSLASGNYKDIFSSFFQLAINNLTGQNKELKFTTNPYAIMLRHNPDLKKFDNYDRTRLWRRFNITLDAKLDTSYRFDGLATGITYALINRRDYSMRRDFVSLLNKNGNDAKLSKLVFALTARLNTVITGDRFQSMIGQMTLSTAQVDKGKADTIESIFQANAAKVAKLALDTLKKYRSIEMDDRYSDEDRASMEKGNREAFSDTIISLIRQKIDAHTISDEDIQKYSTARMLAQKQLRTDVVHKINSLMKDTTLTFDKVDTTFRGWIFEDSTNASVKYLKELTDADPKIIIAKQSHKDYDSLVATFEKKWLITIGVNDTSYSSGQLFKTVQFNTEILKGVFPHSQRMNLELDLKGYVNFLNDSLMTGKNLQRQYWTVEPGVNWVIKSRKSGQSFMEFKLSGGITHVFKGYYADDKNLDVTLAGTLRLRILDELWLPLQIKYDPEKGNVFGFLNVTTNFTGIKSMLKGK